MRVRFYPTRDIRGQVSWQKRWIYKAMPLAISWFMHLPRLKGSLGSLGEGRMGERGKQKQKNKQTKK